MDEFELYKLLEEATGLKKFFRRSAEAERNMTRFRIQKDELAVVMGELRERLKVV